MAQEIRNKRDDYVKCLSLFSMTLAWVVLCFRKRKKVVKNGGGSTKVLIVVITSTKYDFLRVTRQTLC